MKLTLSFGGQALGEVEVGPPNVQGYRAGTLHPNTAYYQVRARLQQPMLALTRMQGAPAEEVRAHLLRSQSEFAAGGLTLLDAAGAQVDTQFLQVVDMYPPDTDPEILESVGIQVGIHFANAT